MDRKIKKYLYDILDSINGVELHVQDRKVYEEFAKNRTMRMAIERELSIIGEAVKRILAIDPNFQLENTKKIIGTRNILAHEYDSIDDITIWSIVINHLPKLKQQVETLLNQNS